MRQPSVAILALVVAASGAAFMQGQKNLDIYSIDVEGGQSTLLVSPSGESLLVDTGSAGERDAGRIVDAAKQAGLKQIDYLVITHYDGDHVGGAKDVSDRMPIRTFIDHGPRVVQAGAPPLTPQQQADIDRVDAAYAEARTTGRHIEVKAGDTVPIKGLDVQIVSSNGHVISKPIADGGAQNPLCRDFAPHPIDTSENINSVGMVIGAFNRFRMVDLGDLTWNTEHDLVCPKNLLGTVDVYLATHHGLARSGPPALVQAIGPRVAILNNGPRKGVAAETWATLKGTPSLQDIWQLHYSVQRPANLAFEEKAEPGGPVLNAPEPFLANLQETTSAHTPAYFLKISVRPDGSFLVLNSRNGYSKEYTKAGQVAQVQHWIGTWFASSSARGDQLAPPAPSAATTNGTIPPAVRAVAPNQELVLAGQSPLHFSNQTLRQIVHITAGGSRIRVVLSNTFGVSPLTIGAAQVALRDQDAAIKSGSNRILTFGGEARATVPAGAILISDPVDLVVGDFADLAIDLYLPGDTAAMKSPITTHAASWQTNYLSPPGNHAGVVSIPVQTTTDYRRGDGLPGSTWFFLSRVEVMAPRQAAAIVTLGDSITDGTASTIDTNNRWPDHLARRLAGAGLPMGVLNAGIGGNRVLNEGNGPSALSRFDRDVIAQPGVTHVIVLEGINDIGQARQNASPRAADLIAAHKQMIERAHARGLKIYGATLTPFEGADYWTAVGEAKRQALNEWIRTSKAYDAVLDFDAAVRDPNHPTTTLAKYDSGDHLHLNAAGYQAVANSIDLALFRSP